MKEDNNGSLTNDCMYYMIRLLVLFGNRCSVNTTTTSSSAFTRVYVRAGIKSRGNVGGFLGTTFNVFNGMMLSGYIRAFYFPSLVACFIPVRNLERNRSDPLPLTCCFLKKNTSTTCERSPFRGNANFT